MAKGFAQQPGQGYNETFSPVVHLETIWVILALVPAKNLRVQQMDVKGAYLNGYLQERVYIQYISQMDIMMVLTIYVVWSRHYMASNKLGESGIKF